MALFGDLGRALSGITDVARQAAPLAATAAAFAAPGAGAPLLTKLGTAATALQAIPVQQQGQAVAVDRPVQTPPQETQESGVVQTGAMLPFVFGGGTGMAANRIFDLGRKLAPGFGGALAFEGGSEILEGILSAPQQAGMAPIINGRKLRVTRKLKTQVRQAVELIGVDAAAAAMGVPVDVVLYILTHKLRNDGPYVTKAAVRKTRSTIKKMKTMCDMYDDLRPPAKRSAPARRRSSSTTLIKN